MIFTKLEIDVMQANELLEATELATKYKFPALVVHPDLAAEAQMTRGRAGGKYKLITPIDWPKGENFGQVKLRGLSLDALDVEGFEILLTGGKSLTDTRNEAKAITEFIKSNLAELVEVRFILGTHIRDEENIITLCEGLVGVRQPAFIRNDTHVKTQVSKANPEIHNNTITLIKKTLRTPIKISGNITSTRTIAACNAANRFAVNLIQAKAIIKEYQQQPAEELRELFSNQ